MWFIVILSIISILTLTYQTVEFYLKGNCCGEELPEIMKVFREYGSFTIYFGEIYLIIPISLIGILLLLFIMLQAVFIGYFPIPFTFRISKSSLDLIVEIREKFRHRSLQLLFYQLLFYSILVVSLISIEIFIIQRICFLCLISQIIIFIDTLLVYLWFSK